MPCLSRHAKPGTSQSTFFPRKIPFSGLNPLLEVRDLCPLQQPVGGYIIAWKGGLSIAQRRWDVPLGYVHEAPVISDISDLPLWYAIPLRSCGNQPGELFRLLKRLAEEGHSRQLIYAGKPKLPSLYDVVLGDDGLELTSPSYHRTCRHKLIQQGGSGRHALSRLETMMRLYRSSGLGRDGSS